MVSSRRSAGRPACARAHLAPGRFGTVTHPTVKSFHEGSLILTSASSSHSFPKHGRSTAKASPESAEGGGMARGDIECERGDSPAPAVAVRHIAQGGERIEQYLDRKSSLHGRRNGRPEQQCDIRNEGAEHEVRHEQAQELVRE